MPAALAVGWRVLSPSKVPFGDEHGQRDGSEETADNAAADVPVAVSSGPGDEQQRRVVLEVIGQPGDHADRVRDRHRGRRQFEIENVGEV
jgi:hypothetical protein